MASDSDEMLIDFGTGEITRVPKFEDVPYTMTWLQQAELMPPPGWLTLFTDSIETLRHIYKIIITKGLAPYFPLDRDVFAAYWHTPAKKIRVVIFGQDPYHDVDNQGYPSAVGLSFSLREQNTKINPSLRVMFESLKECYPGWQPKHGGSLVHWAKQGVLLLNQCLTVCQGRAGSHGDIWEQFMFKTIECINETNPFTIFVLWGKKAQDNLTEYIKARDDSFIITAPHPSPMNAGSSRMFKESKQFLQINAKLMAIGQTPIDW